VGMQDSTLESHPPLRPSQIADVRLAASTMTGPPRRALQAEMALQYCGGNPLRAETIFGWGRHTVEVGLAERRTGIRCLGAQAACSGRTPWEDTPPEAAEALGRLADAHAPPAPTVSHHPGLYAPDGASGSGNLESPRVWGRPIALAQYDGRGAQSHGISAAQSGQSPTAKADGRDRRHCRPYGKKDQQAAASQRVKRVRSDCKATVPIGAGSRGGLTRGDHKACAHDLGLQEKSIPCGIGEEERGHRHSTFGSSYQTSDCIVDALESWWAALDETEQGAMARLQINMAHGPESRGRRTPFWPRMVAFCEAIGQPMQLLYSPPSFLQ
jgi:hypothetical protein